MDEERRRLAEENRALELEQDKMVDLVYLNVYMYICIHAYICVHTYGRIEHWSWSKIKW